MVHAVGFALTRFRGGALQFDDRSTNFLQHAFEHSAGDGRITQSQLIHFLWINRFAGLKHQVEAATNSRRENSLATQREKSVERHRNNNQAQQAQRNHQNATLDDQAENAQVII